MGKYFGTDGFRGRANIDITPRHAYAVGRAICRVFGENGKVRVVLGRDTRISGDMLFHAVCAGIHSLGGDVYDAHISSTPEVSFITRRGGFDCGVMISASHNAFCDNGIKIIGSKGEKINDNITLKIEEYIDMFLSFGDDENATGDKIGKTADIICGKRDYVRDIMSKAGDLCGLKIGIDCANGSACEHASEIFSRIGSVPFIINDIPNGTNINRDCGSTDVKALRELVLNNGLCAGFAFDGDADRCICVDERGNIVDGDKILFLLAKRLCRQGRLHGKTAVVTVMSNGGLLSALDKCGIGHEITDVGDKNLYDRMESGGYTLGGEPSGHIIIRDSASTGDGILTAVEICREMCDEKKSLSALTDIELFCHMDGSVPITIGDDIDEMIADILPRMKEKISPFGRIIMRKSGTEPKLRISVECRDEEKCKKYFNMALNEARSVLGEK